MLDVPQLPQNLRNTQDQSGVLPVRKMLLRKIDNRLVREIDVFIAEHVITYVLHCQLLCYEISFHIEAYREAYFPGNLFSDLRRADKGKE